MHTLKYPRIPYITFTNRVECNVSEILILNWGVQYNAQLLFSHVQVLDQILFNIITIFSSRIKRRSPSEDDDDDHHNTFD